MINNKIGFVIHGLGIGGAEKFLVQVINHFASIGYEPILVVLSNNNVLLSDIHSGVLVKTFLKRFQFDMLVSRRIHQFLIEEKVSKIFCVNTYAFFLTKLFFIFDQKVKFYLSLHSTIPFSRKCFLQNMLYYRLLGQKDTILFLCEGQRKYLSRKYILSSFRNNYIIYNGINVNYYSRDISYSNKNSFIKEKYNIASDEYIILIVARLQSEKCHTDAFKALKILHEKYKKLAHLIVVGDGEDTYRDYLQLMVLKLNLTDYIHFEGNQSDVRKYYVEADFFTLTSKSETFSLSALEAMAFGLPCSLTDVGGAKEMIISGKTGFLSKPNDIPSIAESWNAVLINQFDRNLIREHVQFFFSEKKMLEQYATIVSA